MEEAQSLKDAAGTGEPDTVGGYSVTEGGYSVTVGGLGVESKRSLSVLDAWAIYRQIRFQEQSEENQIVSLTFICTKKKFLQKKIFIHMYFLCYTSYVFVFSVHLSFSLVSLKYLSEVHFHVTVKLRYIKLDETV